MGPSLGTKAKFLTFNGIQSRAVTGLLETSLPTRTARQSIVRRCGVGEETSAHILCKCEALAALRNAYLGYFFFSGAEGY